MIKVFLCLLALSMAPQTCVYAQTEATPLAVYPTMFKPPFEYREWYRRAEVCSERRGDFSRIMWAVVPHPWAGSDSTPYVHAQWTLLYPGDRTREAMSLIVVNADEWRNVDLIMHEALHDILHRSGWKLDTMKLARAKTIVDTVLALHPVPPFRYCAPIVMPKYTPEKPPQIQTGTFPK